MVRQQKVAGKDSVAPDRLSVLEGDKPNTVPIARSVLPACVSWSRSSSFLKEGDNDLEIPGADSLDLYGHTGLNNEALLPLYGMSS